MHQPAEANPGQAIAQNHSNAMQVCLGLTAMSAPFAVGGLYIPACAVNDAGVKRLVITALVLTLAVTTGTASRPKALTLSASLCHPTEQVLFQCALGTRQVAMCSAGAPGKELVQYRFGKPGRIELSYPAEPAHGPDTLVWAYTGFSGGGGMQIHFDNAGTQFVLYSNMVRTGFGSDELNYPMDQLGLFATRNGRLIYDKHCNAHVSFSRGHDDWIDEARTKASLPEGEYIYGPDAFYTHWEKNVPTRH